ncbi:MAG: ATP-binding protein [Bacteriovoracaceae bacterium]|nr:ATP-binding protein [Bacteriovoracaceae bacterium]
MKLNHKQYLWSLKNPLFPEHMSFIAGPRQSGKTTMALQFLKEAGLDKTDYYFNWDRIDVRRKFKDNIDWLSTLKKEKKGGKRPILIFDEIHKVRQWKRLLKGIYDEYRKDFQFIITGSGRLDYFQRGGDSLAGRFDLYQLMPFSPAECTNEKSSFVHLTIEKILAANPLHDDLITHWEMTGGFPEPFLSGSEQKSRYWWKQYLIRVTEEDLRDLTRLESVDLMRDILAILPAKISSPLSIESVRRDVETSFATAKRYLATLNQLYILFEVSPYSKKIHRAIAKEKKCYFYHHPAVIDDGARFENMVALILKKWVLERNEKAEGEFVLNYLRDQDRREVDFILLKEGVPYFLIECKRSDTSLSPSLVFYSHKLNIPGIQVVRSKGYNLKKSDLLAVVSIHYLASVLG